MTFSAPTGSIVPQKHMQASGESPIPGCALEELFDGDWDGLVDKLSELDVTDPAPLVQVRVPPRFTMGVAPDVEAD
jgi:hypothetical protein